MSMTDEAVKKQRVEWGIGKTKKYNTFTINTEGEEPRGVGLMFPLEPCLEFLTFFCTLCSELCDRHNQICILERFLSQQHCRRSLAEGKPEIWSQDR